MKSGVTYLLLGGGLKIIYRKQKRCCDEQKCETLYFTHNYRKIINSPLCCFFFKFMMALCHLPAQERNVRHNNEQI